MSEYQKIFFETRNNLQSLSQYHHLGGELFDGLQVVCEKNYRSKLIDGVLRDWTIGEVVSDITGYGKYSASKVSIEIDGVIGSWPFSMIYIKKTS